MKKIILTILITFCITNLGKAQTLNVPDNIGTSNNAGNVGIGTPNPIAKLDVRGYETQIYNSAGSARLQIRSDYSWQYVRYNFNGFTTWDLGVEQDGDWQVRENGAYPRFIVKKGGNVGIGTTDPGLYKLAVEGKIGAHEIVVTTEGWSDFVFNKDYKLKDLEEVEKFIEENNHLPDIPSEKEVKENGVQVGEMNAKLLQKIEELTLYMIKMNKEMKVLKNENAVLKEKFKKLETVE